MPRKTILVVDDERDLVEIVRFNLLREQYRVLTAYDGEAAVAIAERELPDAVLLDVMLPGLGGLEVCRRLRASPRTARIPIIMLTAKGEETDVVLGLSQGADDYVRKPFGVKELMARVSTQVRRRQRDDSPSPRVLRWGELTIDSDRYVATLSGIDIGLTTTQFNLLRHLVTRPGRVYTRSELLEAIRGAHAVAVDRTVDAHVAAVRSKLGAYGTHLITVRGVGYKFAERASADAAC